MRKTYTEYMNLLVADKEIFLNYLKARFPLFHNSNFFFRDLQYGIKGFFEKRNYKITYPVSEKLAVETAALFENDGIFVRINEMSWKVNMPEFVTVKPGDPF